MNCEEFRERLDEYIDGMADESLQARMDTHAEECAACAELLKQAMDIRFALGDLEEEITPPAFTSAAWKRAVRLEAEKKRRKDVRRNWRAFAMVAAALAVWVGATAIMDQGGLLSVIPNRMDAQPQAAMARYIGGEAENVATAAYTESTEIYLASDGSDEQQTRTIGTGVETTFTNTAAAMRVKNVRSELVAEDLDTALANLDDLVSEMDGYYEFEHEHEENGVRSAELTIRVPSVSLDAFMAEFRAIGNEIDGEYHEDDIAQNYYDADARLELLTVQRDQYSALMAQATSAEELEALAENAEAVQAQIDELEAQKRTWNTSVEYATVAANLSTASDQAMTLGERMAAAWSAAISFGCDMLVSLAYISPFLLIAGAAWAAVVIAKKKKNK